MKFAVEGPEPLFDGRRARHGRAQMTERERRTWEATKHDGMRISHENERQVFWVGDRKVARSIVLHLAQFGYLVGSNDGLFEGCHQTLCANLTPLREPTCQQGAPCGDAASCPDPVGCGFREKGKAGQ